MRTNSLARRRFELMAAEYLERMGARIAARREELGLTQEDIARELPGKISGQRVSLWERGKHRPRDDSLEELARVLQVDVSYFMASAPDKSHGTPDLLGAGEDDLTQLDRIEAMLAEIMIALELRKPVKDDGPARVVEAVRDAAARAGALPESAARPSPQRRATR